MSLEEELLKSVRNLKAMMELWAKMSDDLVTKVAEEFTKEKATRSPETVLVPLESLKADQFFKHEDKLYQKRLYDYHYFAADGTKRKLIQAMIKNKVSEEERDLYHFDSETPVYVVA